MASVVSVQTMVAPNSGEAAKSGASATAKSNVSSAPIRAQAEPASEEPDKIGTILCGASAVVSLGVMIYLAINMNM